MSLFKRVLLGGFPIGLVLTLGLAHSPLTLHTPPQTVHTARQAASTPYVDWDGEIHAYQQAVTDQAAAVAALEAEQAQALADQLAAAAQRSLERVPAPQPAPPVVTPAPTSGDCFGVNPYAAYIYQHESGCRLDAVNGGGCAGIGQACPGSKLPCSLSDAPCQLAYFESYALGRYGSWEAAYQFWLSHGWW